MSAYEGVAGTDMIRECAYFSLSPHFPHLPCVVCPGLLHQGRCVWEHVVQRLEQRQPNDREELHVEKGAEVGVRGRGQESVHRQCSLQAAQSLPLQTPRYVGMPFHSP